jgi:hypothetical protein
MFYKVGFILMGRPAVVIRSLRTAETFFRNDSSLRQESENAHNRQEELPVIGSGP